MSGGIRNSSASDKSCWPKGVLRKSQNAAKARQAVRISRTLQRRKTKKEILVMDSKEAAPTPHSGCD